MQGGTESFISHRKNGTGFQKVYDENPCLHIRHYVGKTLALIGKGFSEAFKSKSGGQKYNPRPSRVSGNFFSAGFLIFLSFSVISRSPLPV